MKKRHKIFLMLIMLLILLVGCTGQTEKEEVVQTPESVVTEEETTGTSTVSKENEMILAMNTPTTLHPLYNLPENVQQVLMLVFSPLINIEENGTISSNIAKSWMVNETETAVTITLRDDVRFHDGQPLTTADVIYTLQQIQQIPDSPYKSAVDNIASMEPIDTYTLKIVYKQAFSGILQTLFFPVIPKHIYDVKDQTSVILAPIGCGPYIFEDFTASKRMSLKANANYFKGKPLIESVQVKIIPDEESSLYAFKQGLIDVVYTDITEWGKYANSKGTTSYEMASNIYEFLGLNLNKGIFQNANIREALLCGINRQDIVQRYYLEHAIVTDTPISPVSYLYDKNIEIRQYDKEKARFLLTQEGYEKGANGILMKNGMPFSLNLLVNAENTDRVKTAKVIKELYAEIGIEVNIEEVDKETYFNRITNKQFDAFLGGFKLSYATDLSFALNSNYANGGENYVSYTDQTMNDLLQKAFLATETTKAEAFNKLQQYFITQNPYISLYFKKSVVMTSSQIKGNVKPTPLNIFANVEEWTKS